MRLIDADALVVKLEDWRGDKEDVDMSDPHDIGYYAAMGRAIRLTALSHTIDAVPVVHAEWRYTIRPMPSRATYTGLLNCPKCNGVFERLTGRKIFSYCPNCGAKMDGDPHDSPGQ